MTQRDETLQELVGKVAYDRRRPHLLFLILTQDGALCLQVDMLHDAFNSLSDVFTCEVGKLLRRVTTDNDLTSRRLTLKRGVAEAVCCYDISATRPSGQVGRLDQTARVTGATNGWKASAAAGNIRATLPQRSRDVFQARVGLVRVSSRASALKNSSEDLMTREREAAHLQKSLQISQEDATEALKRLKEENSQLQVELFALKEQTNGATTTVASDVQVLAKEYSALRSAVSKQQSQWLGKLNALQEAIDRQGKMDKTQLTQRVDALSDAVASQEHRTKDAVDNLLKNHARIRCAVDEGMTICSREIRALSNEVKAVQVDQQEKLDQAVQQMATNSIECGQRHGELHLSLRSIAHRLKVSL